MMNQSELRLLLIEDNPRDVRLCREMLQNGSLTTWKIEDAPTLADGLSKASQSRFDLIILDLYLPDSEGISTFESLISQTHQVPVVILTGRDDQALALEAVQRGAQDYLIKDELTPYLASRSFLYAVERFQLKQQLETISVQDDLSGLYNRRGFFTLAEQQLKLARRTSHPLGLFFIDIDGMKSINDRFGHLSGDQAIRITAEALRTAFRDSDIIARMGGDEFAVLAIESDPDHHIQMRSRLDRVLEQVCNAHQPAFELTFSVGVASWQAEHPVTVEDLLQQADRAMYADKESKSSSPAKTGFVEQPPFEVNYLELLLIEDNPGDARLITEVLDQSEKEIQITHITRLQDLPAEIENKSFSAVLLDLSLPDSQGMGTIHSVITRLPDVPVVVFTGHDDRDMALEAIQTGAQDYLVKGKFDEVDLERSLKYAIERQALQRQNQAFLEVISHSEQNLKSIFNQVEVGIFRAEPGGRLIFANRPLLRMLGLSSPEQASGIELFQDHIQLDENTVSRLLDDLHGEGREIYQLFRNPEDPDPLPIRLRLTSTYLDGEPILTGTVEDISSLLETEQQNQLQASALEAAANAIVITNREGEILWANQAFNDMTGFEISDVVGKSPRILKSGLQDESFYRLMWDAILNGRVWQGELINRRKNGTTYTERMTITPIRDQQGQISNFVAIKEDITQYKRNQDLVQQRLREVTALNKIAIAGLEETNEDLLISRVTGIIGSMIYPDHFGVLLMAKNEQEMIIHESYQGIPVDWLGKTIKIDEGIVGQAARSRQAIIVNNVAEEDDYLQATPGMQSEMVVPLLSDGDLIGVINAESKEKNLFLEDDARLMETIAGELAMAITQIRIRAKEREQREKAELLSDIALALNSSLEQDQVLDKILQEVRRLVPYKTASLFLKENGRARVIRHHGYEELGLAEWIEGYSINLKKSGLPVVESVLKTGQPRLIEDTEKEPDWRIYDQTAWVRSFLVVPILKDNKILGFIFLDHDRPGAFSTAQIDIMQALTPQIITALENAERYRQSLQQVEFLESLRRIDTAITSNQELDLILEVITTELLDQVEADAINHIIHHPQYAQLRTALHQGFQDDDISQTLYQEGGLMDTIIRSKESTMIDNLKKSKLPASRAQLFKEEGFKGYYGIPLLAKNQIVGVTELFWKRSIKMNEAWVSYADAAASQTAIAVDNSLLFQDLQAANKELSEAYDTTLEGWAGALELRDHETEGHARRVVKLTMQLARAMNIPEDQLVHIRRGALLHDIGKMGIPDSILQKPGKLTEEEWNIMRQHPLYAERWLMPISYLRPALDIPVFHHERWDGTGYPYELAGKDIPLAARIFAVVDVWDALLSDRPYRLAWSRRKALNHITNEAGKHFDPAIVQVFLELIEANPKL